jgi:hypothetical protein
MFNARITPDGTLLVAAGRGGPGGKDKFTAAWELPGGKECWRFPRPARGEAAGLCTDPNGTVVGVPTTDDGRGRLLHIRTGEPYGPEGDEPYILGPGPRHLWAAYARREGVPADITLGSWGKSPRLLTVLSRTANNLDDGRFDRTGRLLAWGNYDGSVIVLDLDEIRARLGEVGMGWDTD